jgi:hypothetical protein
MTAGGPRARSGRGAAIEGVELPGTGLAATLGVAALVVVTRLPALLLLPKDRLFNTDELELTFAALDRFLGVPSNVLIWPGATVQALAVPLFAADFAVRSGLHAGPAAFATYLGQSYREPWHALLLLRLLVVALSSGFVATLYAPFSRLLESRAAGLLAVLALATVPAMWVHSHAAMLDAVTFGLACAACATLLGARVGTRHTVLASLVFGVALVTKVTVVPLFPFVLALAVQRSELPWWRVVLLFAAGGLAGVCVACPYLWTDPVRMAKTIVGNATRAGTPMGLARAVRTGLDVVPVWLWLTLALGLAACLRRRWFWVAAGSAVTVALTTTIVARGGVVFPRYMLPVVPCAVVLTVLALREARGAIEAAGARRRVAPGIATAAALGLMVAGNTVLYVARLPEEFREMRFASEVAADVKGLGAGAVVVPWEVFRHVADVGSAASFERLGRACGAEMIRGDEVAKFTARRGVPEWTVRAMPRVFDEEEQAFVAEMAVMSYPADRGGVDLRVCAKPELASRFGFLTSLDAVEMLRRGEVDAIVVGDRPEGLVPVHSYDDKFFLYVREPGAAVTPGREAPASSSQPLPP